MDLRKFQDRSQRWIINCLGVDCYHDREERIRSFFEEATELAQAAKLTKEQAHAMVDHVYARAPGEIDQEVGGVMTCIGVLCACFGLSLEEAAVTELERIEEPTTMDKIRSKQSEKLRFGDKGWLAKVWGGANASTS